ncbi:MAG: antibiotic biosynthesis monooxygenase [Bacillota bacterium]
MIARRWHGRIPASKADEYLKLMKEVGLADYRSTPGNLAAWCLHRAEGDIVHVEMFTLWEELDAVRRFAGAELTKAKYYDFDAGYLLELEPEVVHFEVLEAGAGVQKAKPD